MRQVFTSKEMAFKVKRTEDKRLNVYSFFPIDRANCECQKMIMDFKTKLASMVVKDQKKILEDTKFLVCPRDKTNLFRYQIVCGNCLEIQGYCWASDPSLIDWSDFHYVQWTDGDTWKGCFTPHVSPITQQLCLECTCGNDTRDFRANMTLAQISAERLEEKNAVGREFGRKDSKFIVKRIK